MASKVLVLNQDYQAISVCSVERAFVLVFLNKAEMVADAGALALKTVKAAFKRPLVIRLCRFVHIPFKKVSLTRQNIFKRDSFRCAYCGKREELTLDHIVPRSQGGIDSWHNLVSACQKCNTYKGNRTPEEAGMKMLTKPYRPSFIMFLRDFSGNIHDEWKPFLLMT